MIWDMDMFRFGWKDVDQDKIGRHLQRINTENDAVKPRTVRNNRK